VEGGFSADEEGRGEEEREADGGGYGRCEGEVFRKNRTARQARKEKKKPMSPGRSRSQYGFDGCR
jgi:hypothetical protein